MSQGTAHPAESLTAPLIPRRQSEAYKKRVAERRRERKQEQRSDIQRRAASLAQALMILADTPDYGPFRGEINKLINRVRVTGNRTPDRDLEAVTRAMRSQGCNTVEDISFETDIEEPEVQRILDGMVAVGAARRDTQYAPEVARGPRDTLYFLTGRQASDQVRP